MKTLFLCVLYPHLIAAHHRRRPAALSGWSARKRLRRPNEQHYHHHSYCLVLSCPSSSSMCACCWYRLRIASAGLVRSRASTGETALPPCGAPPVLRRRTLHAQGQQPHRSRRRPRSSHAPHTPPQHSSCRKVRVSHSSIVRRRLFAALPPLQHAPLGGRGRRSNSPKPVGEDAGTVPALPPCSVLLLRVRICCFRPQPCRDGRERGDLVIRCSWRPVS